MAQKYTKPATATKTVNTTDNKPVHLIYDKSNYRLLVISILVVAIGFVLMSGTTDIYSTTKIVIAPIVVLAGFGLGFYAVLKKPAANKA